MDYKHTTFLLNIFIRVDVDTIIQATDKWCSIFSRAVQVEDGQVIEQVVYILIITYIIYMYVNKRHHIVQTVQ